MVTRLVTNTAPRPGLEAQPTGQEDSYTLHQGDSEALDAEHSGGYTAGSNVDPPSQVAPSPHHSNMSQSTPQSRRSPPPFTTGDASTGANTNAWRIGDPPPPIPTLKIEPPGQPPRAVDDVRFDHLSLEDQPILSPNSDPSNSKNPFLRKRSDLDIHAAPESSATIWDSDNPTASAAPQLDPIPQESLIQLDAEDPWSDAQDTPHISKTLPKDNEPSLADRAVWEEETDKQHPAQQSIPPTAKIGSSPTMRDESPMTRAKRERNEIYQIKHILWTDATSRHNPRSSPILIQNANGPCPLLALVNVLVLSTPSELITPLIETLRTREQVSLGLLLDAVFDELMSDRRSGNTPNLPDVGDLYSFLVTLHTGMNVNPRFVPQSIETEPSTPLDDELPGSFEETREMLLYGVFKIPLIHGWLPHRHEMAYRAFKRTAQTYEDAQNVQFREEDLEQKSTLGVITSEDERTLKDLTVMKHFFSYWPTQLTAHGLDVMMKYTQPGQMAILFRNDHFSTLYREPRSNMLMTLVTDVGFATHDEIVWQSLVDINGAEAEWYSGDFRSVSHDGVQRDQDASGPGENGWQTVEGSSGGKRRSNNNKKKSQASDQIGLASRSEASLPNFSHTQQLDAATRKAIEAAQYGDAGGRGAASTSAAGASHPSSSSTTRQRTATEQEDHDLALALQLQEEEEQRQHEEAAARRAREDSLSQQYIEQESRNPRSGLRIPPRRSGPHAHHTSEAVSNSSGGGGAAPAAGSSAGDENSAPPPPYERAASAQPFIPPPSHPSSEFAPMSPVASSSSLGNASPNYTGPSGGSGAGGQQQQQQQNHRIPRRNLPSNAQVGSNAGQQGHHSASRSLQQGRPMVDSDREEKCNVM